MASINCEACDELRTTAPGLVVNGLDDTMCASLQNNTGLSPSSGNNDCTDLNNMNDCLVGNMAAEIEAYDVCDWKTFMKKFIPNAWTTLKGIICAICGLWTNITNLWEKLNESSQKLDCIVGKLGGEVSFFIDGLTNADLGSGVQWRQGGEHDAYPSLKGNAFVLQVNGSLKFTGSKWLNKTGTTNGNTNDGNWLVYRYKIKLADYGIKKIWSNTLMTNNGGCLLAYAHVWNEGQTYPGQWGWDDTTGAGTVPAGYTYIDIRVSNIITWGITGDAGNVTFTGVLPILTTADADC